MSSQEKTLHKTITVASSLLFALTTSELISHDFKTGLIVQWLHVKLCEADLSVLLRKCVMVAKEVGLVVVSHMSQVTFYFDSGG